MNIKQKLLLLLICLFTFVNTSFSASGDIEITADNGLEWSQKNKEIRAIENAVARTGAMTLRADEIIAKYREKNGDKEIYQIVADKNVVIKSPKEEIAADDLVYDLDKNTITLNPKENPVVLKAMDSKIVSEGKVLYYEKKNTAQAFNATIHHASRTISSDTLNIYFKNSSNKNKKGLELSKVIANGNVSIKDGAEELKGDVADYNRRTGIVNITGNVSLVKGDQANLKGGKITYNMNTGITKIIPAKNEKSVKGIFKTPK